MTQKHYCPDCKTNFSTRAILIDHDCLSEKISFCEYCGELNDLELQLKIHEVITRLKHSKDYKDAEQEFYKRYSYVYNNSNNREPMFILFDWLEESNYKFLWVTRDKIRKDPDILLHKIVIGAF